jgi:dolichyl-phosphate-mannose--protein O-mannosyl transferase
LIEENVRCGDIIRLEHALTNKNLHSHNIAATLSGNPKTEVLKAY